MPGPLPEVVSRLLAAQSPDDKDQAWEALVAEYSRLVHSVARKSSPDYDALMDRYAYVLERLREDDFKRIRSFEADRRSKFTTWLVVVSSRLCVDWHRGRYGRWSSSGEGADEAQARRNLVDLVGDEVALDRLEDAPGTSPEVRVRRAELSSALRGALETLEPEDRLLLRLRFEDRRPAPEIAEVMGLSSEFAAYRRLKRVLGDLREELEGRGVEGSSA